jgi:uncharacterized membrane protein
MKTYEATEILGSIQYRDRDNKDMARMIAQVIAQVNSKKTIKSTDIVKFPWDDDKPVAVVTDEEREELAKRAEAIKRQLWQT